MNRMLRSPLVSRAVSSFCLLLLVFTQIIPLRAESWPTQWSFERLVNSSSEWWHSLRVQTVPGVLYHLQQSETLDDGSWTTVETTYGSGEEWICPLMQGDAPPNPPPSGQPVVPPVPANPIRLAYLIIEKTETGGTLVSWSSLDDHTPKRMVLSGVTLDPVWDEFDAPYFNQHGNFYFALSPNMHRTVNFSAPAPSLGTLDTEMITEFNSSLATITSNITQSVANAALFSHQSQPAGARKFYRIAADWSLDSDGDGRRDWQELNLDGNNPFVADSDGDGTNDVAANNSGPSVNDTPATTGDDPPVATIECNRLSYQGSMGGGEASEYHSLLYSNAEVYGDASGFDGLREFDDLADAIAALPLREDNWASYTSRFDCSNWSYTSDDVTYDDFLIQRVAYRLRLDGPAPAGGYSIPMRVARFSMENIANSTVLTDGPYSNIGFEDLTLTVPEGQTLGTPVFAACSSTPAAKHTTYLPLPVDLAHSNLDDEPNFQFKSFVRGACVLPEDCIMASMPGYGWVSDQIVVKWRKHRLHGDGSIGDPEELVPLLSATDKLVTEQPLHLHSRNWAFFRIEEPGIYRFDAQINFPDGTKITAPYLRMKHAKGRFNSKPVREPNPHLEAGQPDYIGVCPNIVAFNVRQRAINWIGSTKYAKANQVGVVPDLFALNPPMKDRNKCNIFVTHMANWSGATTPYFYRHIIIPTAPIARGDWHTDPEKNIDLDGPGWRFQGKAKEPSPGMSAASYGDRSDPNASGHVGLLDYDGSWISAGPLDINKSIHLADESEHYKPTHFRTR